MSQHHVGEGLEPVQLDRSSLRIGSRNLCRLQQGVAVLVVTPFLGDVVEEPDPSERRAAGGHDARRVPVEDAAVLQTDVLPSLFLRARVEVRHAAPEAFGVLHQGCQRGEDGLVGTRCHHRAGNPPHLGEPAVRRDDGALRVHHQDPLDRGLALRLEERPSEGELSFDAAALGRLPLGVVDQPSQAGHALVGLADGLHGDRPEHRPAGDRSHRNDPILDAGQGPELGQAPSERAPLAGSDVVDQRLPDQPLLAPPEQPGGGKDW